MARDTTGILLAVCPDRDGNRKIFASVGLDSCASTYLFDPIYGYSGRDLTRIRGPGVLRAGMWGSGPSKSGLPALRVRNTLAFDGDYD